LKCLHDYVFEIHVSIHSLTKNYELFVRRFRAQCDGQEANRVSLGQIEAQHKLLELDWNKLRPQVMHLQQEKGQLMRYSIYVYT